MKLTTNGCDLGWNMINPLAISKPFKVKFVMHPEFQGQEYGVYHQKSI